MLKLGTICTSEISHIAGRPEGMRPSSGGFREQPEATTKRLRRLSVTSLDSVADKARSWLAPSPKPKEQCC